MKYKHAEDTYIVLDDLANRVQQLIEASEANEPFEGGKYERQAFNSVLALISQVRNTGHVFRGSSAVPDGLLPYVKTPSFINPLKVEK